MPEDAVVKTDPDPSVATTTQALRFVASTREIIEARLSGYDKAIELLQKQADRQPSIAEVASSVIHLKELIQTQLKERDVRSEQTKKDGEVAIAAALQAQKEAVGKTELGFTKELDAVKANMNTETEGLRTQLVDLKVRQNTSDGRISGSDETKKGIGDSWVILVLTVGMILNIVATLWQHH
jgi:hypothetical protein